MLFSFKLTLFTVSNIEHQQRFDVNVYEKG